MDKLTSIRSWVDTNKSNIDVIVDGGVSDKTAVSVIDAGANILVAGSYLFRAHSNLEERSKGLLSSMV